MNEPTVKIVNGKEILLTKKEITAIKKEWADAEAKAPAKNESREARRDIVKLKKDAIDLLIESSDNPEVIAIKNKINTAKGKL